MATRTVGGLIDRTGWGPGPWDDEPDRAEWADEATGYPCLARRNHSGVWCGYVAVPPGHLLHGTAYDDVEVGVHGGLTYASPCQNHGPDEADLAICHVPEPGEPDDVWWFGFDCHHLGDYSPSQAALLRRVRPESLRAKPYDHAAPFDQSDPFAEQYRTLDYVRKECTELAAQLADGTTSRVVAG